MKKVCLWITILLMTGCFLWTVDTFYREREVRVQSEVAKEVIRFHVRANSEGEQDQSVKMEVKKAVIAYLQPILESMDTVQEAKTEILAHLQEVQQLSEAVLENCGCSYGASVSFHKERFPEKTYGDCTFPAGIYDAVVVELGSGEGHNWWCMLYPGLCFVEDTYGVVDEEKKEELEQVLSEDSYGWITEPENRKITFRWEWLRKILEFPI